MSIDSSDHAYMARALRLAERGLYTAEPNPRVGCVVVSGDTVVGEGWHRRTGDPHAEVIALEQAGDGAAGATAYVTLEPCSHAGRTPPCTDRIIESGIARVVYAVDDPNPAVAGQGAERLVDAGIEVVAGPLERQCRALNAGFFSRMLRRRPLVRSKIAASADGRTALANGQSQWITGEAARRDVQAWRARSSAILTGVETVLADDPSMNVRDESLGDVRQPLRVIVDSQLRTPATARMLTQPGDVLIFCAATDSARRESLTASGTRVEPAAGNDERVSLPAVLDRLAELEVNEVFVEAGPTLNGSLLRAGLIDELIVYTAPTILGSDARGMFDIGVLDDMSGRTELELVELRRVGDECRIRYAVRQSG